MADLTELKERFKQIVQELEPEEIKRQIKKIQEISAQPDFWNQPQKAGAQMKKLARLQEELGRIETLELFLMQLENSPADEELVAEVLHKLEKLEERLFLSGPYDANNAILSIYPGQGGTEAMDWAQMLLRMYLRFAEHKGWKTKVLQQSPGEEAGIKEAVVEIRGELAYGLLNHETGTHRLVRQSPFNADNLRQTSFARVEVIPVIEADEEVTIDNSELEFSASRAGGPGGQSVNKTASAVRLKHKPSGITVRIATERSQHRNRETALEILRGKLARKKQEERKKQKRKLRGEYQVPGWGNQIRSYVLHPYQMVKDHRTKLEISDAEAVLDGDLDELIEAELHKL